MNTKRPTSLMVALALLVLLSLGNFVLLFVPGANQIPAAIVYSGIAAGVLGLIAANSLWKARRWGMILTIIVSAFNLLSSAPGVLAGPNPGLQVLAGAYAVLSAVVIVLVVLPSARRAYTAERVSSEVVQGGKAWKHQIALHQPDLWTSRQKSQQGSKPLEPESRAIFAPCGASLLLSALCLGHWL